MDDRRQQITVEDYIRMGGSAWPLVWDELKAMYASRGINLDWNDVERRIRERNAPAAPSSP